MSFRGVLKLVILKAFNMTSSLAACVHSVGFEMPCVHEVVRLLDVDSVVKARIGRLQSTGSIN